MSKPIRVLVFGTTGVGKTSLCNTLSGENEPVSNAARGVTFKSRTSKPFYLGEKECVITDTVGLNETDKKGTVPAKYALKNLVELLKNSEEGYNLLIHVFRAPRLVKTDSDNYELFVKTVADSRIPVILVVTNCENEEPMSKWGQDNAHTFRASGLIYKDIISTCFAKDGRFEPVYADLREESRENLSQAILAYASPYPVTIYENSEGIFAPLKRAWNWFCRWADLDSWVMTIDSALRDNLYKLLITLGFSENEAKQLSRLWSSQ